MPGLARGLSGKAEEELLDLACDGTLRIRFGQGEHVDFWPSVEQEYPEIAAVAMRMVCCLVLLLRNVQ
ncbi:hypothetical protein F7725_002812 [Dissostichus mawsoni]|uniref:Uncharacterized protein n=1 Tax=Dissostichus mawsoni TaxID=36200 RepID=A0A7J5Y8F5_DISMA|nr:hypothetical protein F7725_002812 [Dissostichus mawsoni]